MNLSVWRKRDPINGGLARLRDEMERTFDRFFNEPFGVGDSGLLRTEGWVPPLDMSETDNELLIRAETPGIPAKDIEVSVTGNMLTISGKKEEAREERNANYYHSERRFGSFRRVVELPASADTTKVSAEADNGVVTIHIAKKAGLKPTHIEVKPVGKKEAVTT